MPSVNPYCRNYNNMGNSLLNQLAHSGAVSVTVTLADLTEFADYLVGNAINIAKTKVEEEAKNTTYLTSKEVMAKCGVSDTTLWRWMKSGYLKASKVGGINRFLLADVESVLSNDGLEKTNRNVALLADGQKHNVSELEGCDLVELVEVIKKRNLIPYVEDNLIWITSNIK